MFIILQRVFTSSSQIPWESFRDPTTTTTFWELLPETIVILKEISAAFHYSKNDIGKVKLNVEFNLSNINSIQNNVFCA